MAVAHIVGPFIPALENQALAAESLAAKAKRGQILARNYGIDPKHHRTPESAATAILVAVFGDLIAWADRERVDFGAALAEARVGVKSEQDPLRPEQDFQTSVWHVEACPACGGHHRDVESFDEADWEGDLVSERIECLECGNVVGRSYRL
jgi:hypothetical protein